MNSTTAPTAETSPNRNYRQCLVTVSQDAEARLPFSLEIAYEGKTIAKPSKRFRNPKDAFCFATDIIDEAFSMFSSDGRVGQEIAPYGSSQRCTLTELTASLALVLHKRNA